MKYFAVEVLNVSTMQRIPYTVEAGALGAMYEQYGGDIRSIREIPWHEFFHVPVLHSLFYVELVDCMGSDLSPLENARLSTGNATGVDVAKDDGLRDRLWRDKHTSPWEACVAAVELVVPMAVLRQLDRHRTVDVSNTVIEEYDDFRKYTSRNEFSARYSEMPDLYYLPGEERFKPKGTANKQGSEGELAVEKRARAHQLVC